MPTRLYVMPISNAAAAGAAMVAHKRIPHRLVRLMPGLHPLLVRFAGFEGFTVPALELDGRKLQGSRRIARFLDEVRPEPPLFPADPEQRARVEEAERWGEQVFQPVPRRLFRHLLLTSSSAREWMGTEIMHVPAPRVLAVLFMPVIRRLAQISRADGARVRQDIAELPELLDHVDGLIAAGTIGAAGAERGRLPDPRQRERAARVRRPGASRPRPAVRGRGAPPLSGLAADPRAASR